MRIELNKYEPVEKSTIAGNTIGKVNHYEYVGMRIDHRLNMNKKANKKLGIISRIRMFILGDIAARIYKTMIRPHLECVDSVIGSGSMNLISKLDLLQERALCRVEYC